MPTEIAVEAQESNQNCTRTNTAEDIRRTLEVLFEPGQVIELRVPKTKHGTVSGYYDDFGTLADDASALSGHVQGVYVTANPVRADLLARSQNRTTHHATSTTTDKDISRRRWFFVDFDPIRPTGVSSTDEEHEAALQRANGNASEWLRNRGWSEPVIADSGNGAHLLYRIELPNDDASTDLVRQCLAALDMMFTDNKVEVDTVTFNASRIVKLYGTLAAKGDDTPARPHRMSQLISVPSEISPVDIDLLRQLVATLPQGENEPARRRKLDISKWLEEHRDSLPPICKTAKWNGGDKWVFHRCPWNSEHTDRSAFIVQFPNGAIAAGCHHNGCEGKNWHALRDLVEPEWRQQRDSELCTDTRNGQEFAADHAQYVRYVPAWGWLKYDGKRWARAHYEEMMALAKKTARRMLDDATKIADDDKRTKQLKHAVSTEQVPSLKKMLEAAQSESTILAHGGQFDADPMMLNCENGVLDLRTGKLNKHDPNKHLTKLANVEYDPTAKAPKWEEFLAYVLPDTLIRYLQRWAGYCMTGTATEQAVLFLWGDGQNGKTTATEVPRRILGDYAQTVKASTIIRHNNNAIPNDVADLKGIRYALIAEYPENKPLDEAFIKSATGGENIRARHLYKEAFEFKPVFKALVSTNNKPIVIGGDYGIWRRIKLIPFKVRIPNEKKDQHFMNKLFDHERSGILNWMLQGCMDWQKHGLQEPRAVTEAVKEYRNEMDVIAQFLNDCTVSMVGEDTLAETLYSHYKLWCDLNEHWARSQKRLGIELKKRLESGRDGAGRTTYKNIRLKDSEG